MEMVRSIMIYPSFPSFFGGYALEIANCVLNLVHSKLICLIHKELWTGCKPSLRDSRVWGCPSHALMEKWIN